VIKFTTLFGLLAVELAIMLPLRYEESGATLTRFLAIACFVVSAIFVWRSFYRMRIPDARAPAAPRR
jgi:K(+)-stimulated pyrophosphate-energized sodium pump